MSQNDSEFNSIQISLASPELIRSWSYGEVTQPETINYRTLRPEKDGLFCDRIFGPQKDWECACGKYKKIRFKGVKCERCGVEVTRSKVRRERMGHISLAAPVAHIWFSKSVPSRIGVLLDISPRNLERVIYFAQYIVTHVDEDLRKEAIERLKENHKQAITDLASKPEEKEGDAIDEEADPESTEEPETAEEAKFRLESEFQENTDILENVEIKQLLVESEYRKLRELGPDMLRASMGAEAILELLRDIDLDAVRDIALVEMNTSSGQRRKKAIKHLRIVESFRNSSNKPEWMILDILPVLPPDLRPMVQLDGGRFATSDLNDLYRRVINRNNRLRRLIDLFAPEIIIRNEKRMLQEAVDALIDNGRRGRVISGSHNHKLKSLSDLLRGKQGRFRQNLLGKRVDYSGRSVIVAGPELKLSQCGIPKRMAMELFKPFVMHRLVVQGLAHNIKSAKRIVEGEQAEVWDILESVVDGRTVFLNRAPTLHRLGIQAFTPVLIEGNAIQLHPLVCTAFNADFDGDQMAVHIPLSQRAIIESKKVMMSTYNMLSPASGEPIVTPTLDIVLGCYYLTTINAKANGSGMRFTDTTEALLAHDLNHVELQAEVLLRNPWDSSNWIKTSIGRIIFNETLPDDIKKTLGFQNTLMDKNNLKELVATCYNLTSNEEVAAILDRIKYVGFTNATNAGITIAINDLNVPPQKNALIEAADKKINQLEEQYNMGLITTKEKYDQTVKIWTDSNDEMSTVIEEYLPNYGDINIMASSGAKGNIAQIKQMVGMRGLMSDPKGRIIDRPVKASFREGLSVLDYFISTHGARKGLADTALRTADSGYLTRRLIDVSQNIIVLENDCGSTKGRWIRSENDNSLTAPFSERIAGRISCGSIGDPKTGEIIVEENQEITKDLAEAITAAKIEEVYARSPLTCQASKGMCQLCYGVNPATGMLVGLSEAVGITAAQSIGEPGTQLTMRTFHTGGVAGIDITTGIPRVEELFEARIPKIHAVLSEIDGIISHEEVPEGIKIRISQSDAVKESHPIPAKYEPTVTDGDYVKAGSDLFKVKKTKTKSKETKTKSKTKASDNLTAKISGTVKIKAKEIIISWQESDEREYVVPKTAHILQKAGDRVAAGQQLTAGLQNLHDILRIKGKEYVEEYFIQEVQNVYRGQGVTINDKHIEVILRQMLRRVRVDSSGDTNLLPGELSDRYVFEDNNNEIIANNGEPAKATTLLLGVTKASLSTESFLAAASFQETTRVLTEAAIRGATDTLSGLKENVIIGHLIPARSEVSEELDNLMELEQKDSESSEPEESSENLASSETADTETADTKTADTNS